jgi:hypothetical protein
VKTIVYDIYCLNQASMRQAVREYALLLRELKTMVSHIIGDYTIRVDVGAYTVNSSGCISESQQLRIHLLLQGEKIKAIEDAIGTNVASFPHFHNFEKCVFPKGIFSRRNNRLLNKVSRHRQMIKCRYKRHEKRSVVSVWPSIMYEADND